MATSSTSAFLDGQGIPVDPKDIESELEALWGPAAEQAGGPDLDHPAVTKVVLANVIVSALSPETARTASVLDEVAARYPCRAIILRKSDDAERRVRAEVSALCHLPAPGMPQVCSEQIVLYAGPGALDLLPGAVRPLLESDLPCILWWTDSLRETSALFTELNGEATRVILDRPDPAADPGFLKVPTDRDRTRDAAWYGITIWRELLAQFFDARCHRDGLDRIAAVEIRTISPLGDRPARAATWLVAWLAGQLGWRPVARSFDPARGLDATFEGPSGTIAVAICNKVDAQAAAARITEVRVTTKEPGGEGMLHLTRSVHHPDEVRIDISSATHCNLPRRVRAPEADVAHQVASALQAGRQDLAYQNALPRALWLLGLD